MSSVDPKEGAIVMICDPIFIAKVMSKILELFWALMNLAKAYDRMEEQAI